MSKARVVAYDMFKRGGIWSVARMNKEFGLTTPQSSNLICHMKKYKWAELNLWLEQSQTPKGRKIMVRKFTIERLNIEPEPEETKPKTSENIISQWLYGKADLFKLSEGY